MSPASPTTPTTVFAHTCTTADNHVHGSSGSPGDEASVHAIENLDELPTAPSIDPVERERLARCLFALPANEPLLHDVYASCKINSVYFAGRLYIFKRFVAFYTSSFGTDTRRLVPLQRVQAIRRRQHLSQNTALEIKYDDSKYLVVANLQDREGVFNSLLDLWEASNPEAFQYYKDNVSMQQTWREKKIRKMVGMVGMGGMLSESASVDNSLHGTMHDEDEELARTATSMEEDLQSEAPPAHKDAMHVGAGDMQGTVQEYVRHILFGDFMRRFQPVDDNPMVLARQMYWTLQKKNAFGSNLLDCNQNQRLSLYAGHHVVLQTELTIPAVPYGDYFVVCARWDVQPGTSGTFSWEQSAWVSFVKDTMFKRQIISSVMSGMKESNQLQVKAIAEELKRQQEAPPVSKGESPNGEQQVESSLRSLINRMPSMMRADVYSMVKSRLDGDAKVQANSQSQPAQLADTLSRLMQQQRSMLWICCVTTCINCIMVGVLLFSARC